MMKYFYETLKLTMVNIYFLQTWMELSIIKCWKIKVTKKGENIEILRNLILQEKICSSFCKRTSHVSLQWGSQLSHNIGNNLEEFSWSVFDTYNILITTNTTL